MSERDRPRRRKLLETEGNGRLNARTNARGSTREREGEGERQDRKQNKRIRREGIRKV